MTHLDHDAVAAVRVAQLTVINAKWHILEEQALRRLAPLRGLACTPLFPGHPVIQVVACGGRLLGRARRHHSGRTTSWIAVPAGTAREIGAYRTLHGAVRALARHAGTSRHRVTETPAPRARPEPAGPRAGPGRVGRQGHG
ncbi:hypothetical protein [Streptomyces nodosus]|uniref:Uncharacterized protein n=1 Tax=Streptomyces nodosus TaxID=40318 RepID=A0A5P2W0K7_9ACTN|nr:hypothetical protein [Streptomyces nodosus]MBB4790015.1 hypothetical protein [Streptomyces nodosus]QEV37736.1 hypothetical protein CP978_03515 [Streptomyces nodosus]